MRTVWKVRIKPVRAIRCAGRPVMSAPASMTLPSSSFWKPEMQSIAVLLPEPLGPISPVTLPRSTSNETPSSACTPAYDLRRSLTDNSALIGEPGACERPRAGAASLRRLPA